MNSLKTTIRSLVVLLCVCLAHHAMAKQPHFTAKYTTVAVSQTSTVYDQSLSASDSGYLVTHAPGTLGSGEKYWTNAGVTWYDKSVKNRLVFYIQPENSCLNSAFTATITVELKKYNWYSGTYGFQTENKTLTINYDPANVFSKKVVYEFPAGYKLVSRITALTTSDATYNSILGLETEFEAERYFGFNNATNFPTGLGHSTAPVADKSEFLITWNEMKWAEEYDLEWTFIDYHSDFIAKNPDGSIDPGGSMIPANFNRFNSTRVTTTNTYYNIPAVYGKGIIVYRVRGYGKSPDDQFIQKVPGIWSTEIDSDQALEEYTFFETDGHELEMNWQFATVFAEEGKNKVSMKYFDGSMRQRQEVSKMNTGIILLDETTDEYTRNVRNSIVSEIIYDHQGRAAINVLPVPTQKEQLRFYDQFNRNAGGTAPYSRINFDTDRVVPCAIAAGEMSTDHGASNYYSPDNIFLTSLASPQINKTAEFIPDAQKYPFTHTQYMPDNTGKILAKSGAGKDHQIGTGLETRYFYGRPFQEELDRLFGAEVGYAEHYKKNVTRDPNGQLSISYLNMEDKVIATTLTGSKPDNVAKVETYKPANDEMDVDLLNKVLPTDHFGKGETFNMNERSRTLSHDFFVADEGTRDFRYKLINDKYTDTCLSKVFCYECVLDLKISIRNECGVQYLNGLSTEGGSPVTTMLIDRTHVLDSGKTIPNNCLGTTHVVERGSLVTPWQSNTTGTATAMKKGTFTLNKTLTVNQAALDIYTKNFLDSNQCFKTQKQAFIDQEKAKIDTSFCTFDCSEWLARIGSTWEESPLNTPDSIITEEEYNVLFKNYMEQCDQTNRQCKAAYEMMLQDVSPLGQYGEIYTKQARYDINGKFIAPDYQTFSPQSFALSVFNENNYLPWKKKINDNYKAMVPGLTSYWTSWRFPFNYSDTNTLKRTNYLDSQGELAYVYLEKDPDGQYIPKVYGDDYSLVEFYEGRPRILVKDLADVKDLISLWEPAWAKSLVAHHPEFMFYIDCISKVESNSFDDQWLNAQTAGGADTLFNNGLTDWDFPLGYGANYPINILDPFFNYTINLDFANNRTTPTAMNATGQAFYDAVKYKMEHFIVAPAYFIDLTMKEAALIIANCPDIDLANCGSGSSDLIYNCLYNRSRDITTPQEWRIYRQLYFSLKQRAAEAWSLKKSIDTGYYNGCIGEKVFNVAKNWFYYAYYDAPATASIAHPWFNFVHQLMFWAMPKQQFFNPDQPCNWGRYWLYKNKNVRYRQTEALYDIEALKSNNANFALKPDGMFNFGDDATNSAIIEEAKKVVGIATYKANCGQCPVAENMVTLLNSFKQNSELITGYHTVRTACGSNTPDYQELTQELSDRLLPAYYSPTSGIQYKGVKYASGGSNYLGTYFKDDNGGERKIDYKFPSSLPYDADDIVRFCCIRGNTPLGKRDSFNFKVTVFVKLKSGDPVYAANDPGLVSARAAAGNPILREITLEASSTEIDLIHCDNLPLCKPSEAARFMMNFLNAGLAMPLHSVSNIQASVKRDTSGILFISNPWQETFTDVMAKVLFPGTFNNYYDEYRWTGYIGSLTSTEEILYGSFQYKGGGKAVTLKMFRDPSNLNVSRFQYIKSFNSIIPKLGFPNVAIIKATACSSNVCTLVTIEMDLGFSAGTCTVGLPDGLTSGESASTNKVKPDIGNPADYGISTLSPPWETSGSLSTGSTTPPDSPCTNPFALKKFILGTIQNTADSYDSTKWTTEWNPCPFGHGWVPTIVKPYQHVEQLPCGDCALKFIFPPIGFKNEQGTETPYSMNNVVALNAFRTIGPREYEVDVTTHDGNKITIKVRLNDCGIPDSVSMIDDFSDAGGGGGGIGDGDGKCRPTEVLNFHNFSIYYGEIPQWDDTVYPGEYILVPGKKYYFDAYSKDFTTDLDTNRRYRFDSINSSNLIDPGKYSIVALGQSYQFLNYGSCNFAMRYKNTSWNTWDKIWESASNISIKKDTAYTFTVWHKELNPYASYPEEESQLQIFFADTQASCVRTIFRSGAEFWVRYDVLLLSSNDRSGKIRIETKSTGSRECLLTGIQLLRDCGPTYCCPMPMPTIALKNPCHEQLESIALENAEIRYQEYIKPLIIKFQQGYIKKCLNVYEEFFMKYQDSEDHTTLYYYDQAGNLVRTIPPKGVVKITDAGKLARIKEDRAKGLRREFTDHEFKTTYTYNSLNQLQHQSMPDNDNMPIWNASVKNNGVPSTYTVKDIRFTDKLNGVLVANDASAGHIYKTTDGGENWTEINAFGLPDINSIASDNVYGPKYVVGDNGLVMMYASSQWNIKILPTAERLVKINLVSSEYNGDFTLINTRLWVHDEKGTGWLIKCDLNPSGYTLENWSYEGPYTALSDIITGKLEDIHIPQNVTYSLSSLMGYAVTDNGKIYRTDDEGYTWQPDISSTKLLDNLTAMHFNASNQGYIGGANGLLLKGALVSGLSTQPARWRIVPGNLTTNITKLHFLDADRGFVLGADFNIYYTKNGGTTFTDINITDDVADFTFASSTAGCLVTKTGKIYRTTDGGLTWPLYSQILSGGSPVYTSGGTEAKRIRYTLGATNSFLMVTGNSTVYYSLINGLNTWTALSVSTPLGADTISDLFLGQLSNNMKANFLLSSGNIKMYTAASATWSNLYTGANASKMFFTLYDKGAIWCSDNRVKYYNSATSSWDNRLYTASAINAFAYSPDYANLLVVGNSGMIQASEGAAATSQLDLSYGIYMPKLNGVSCYTQGYPGYLDPTRSMIVSQSGLLMFGMKAVSNNYTEWTVKKNALATPLNDVKLNASGYTVAGAAGIAFSGTYGAVPGTLTTASSIDYNAVISSGLVAGVNGKVLGIPSTTYTTPVTTSTINGGEGDYVVGDNGYIATKSSTTYTRSQLIASEKLNAIVFVNASLGYAGGNKGALWKTTNGGKTWKNIQITALASVMTPQQITGISFVNETTGFVVATNGPGGNLLKTTDGETFTAVTTGTSNDLMAIDINSNGLGYIVGKSGTLLKTTNSGTTWSLSSVSGSPDLNSVSVPDYNLAYFCGDNSKLYSITPSTSAVLQEQTPGTSWPSFLVAGQRDLKDIHFTDRKTGYVTGQSGFMMKTVDGGAIWKAEQSGTALDVNALAQADETTLYTGAVTGTVTKITDLKDRYSSKFYYDALGRLVVSQNTKQYNKVWPASGVADHLYYSYTLFDFKGRIVEVGELHAAASVETNYNSIGMLDDTKFNAWVDASTRKEITRTFYDISEFSSRLPVTFTQANLRNRVASTAYYPEYSTNNTTYRSASHYTYDIHGNVSTLLQENVVLAELGHSFKRIDYTYDLVSGKVIEVAYQHGNPDRFYHRYNYDGDNRITSVQTSYDRVVWENDAKYLYYLHGPLARTELAQDQVQGMDYAYTIQGWLKTVNGGSLDLDAQTTMGQDGVVDVDNHNSYFGKDEIAYELNYYNNDYIPVASAALTSLASVTGTDYKTALNSLNLYNGNISGMITSHRQFMATGKNPLATAYAYDQLNRLKDASYFSSTPSEDWESTKSYHNQFNYDANGNITKQTRKGSRQEGYDLDSLTYQYYAGTNRLRRVDDVVGYAAYTDDINDQLGGNNPVTYNNYEYDELGNLIRDKAEEIDTIKWNISGKITHIIRTSGSTRPNLEFQYDPSGNRILKIVSPKIGDKLKIYTFYVRDAQGNVMSTYTRSYDKDVNYAGLNYCSVDAAIVDAKTLSSFGSFVNWLHVSNDNSNSSFLGALDGPISGIKVIVEEGAPYFGPMIYDLGIFDDAYAQLTDEEILNWYAMGMGDEYALKTLLQELCNCYEEQHGSDPGIPGFVQLLFNQVIPGVGSKSPREIFLTYLYEYDNVAFFDFVNQFTSPSYDFTTDLDYLLTVDDPDKWEGAFNKMSYDCKFISTVFAYGYYNSGTYGYTELFGGIFSHLPDIRHALNPNINSCGISGPDLYSASQYISQSSHVQSYLAENASYEMTNWLLYNATANTLGSIVNHDYSLICNAQQAVPGIYGGMEGYFNLIKQYYGDAYYQALKAQFLNSNPLFVDKLKVNEQYIYGSSRVGSYRPKNVLTQVKFTATATNGNFSNIVVQNVTNMTTPTGTYPITRGQKQYELSNHLGNVLAVLSDRKTASCSYVVKYSQSFDGGTTGSWNNSYYSNFVVDGTEQLNVKSLGVTAQVISPAVTYTIGKKYQLSFDLLNMEAGNYLIVYTMYPHPSYFVTWIGENGHYNITFTATATNMQVYMNFQTNVGGSAPVTFSLDNVEIRELPGTIESYTAQVLQADDYSPFGAPLAGRNYTQGRLDNTVVDLYPNNMNVSKWKTIFCTAPTSCTSPEATVTLVQDVTTGKLKMTASKRYSQAYYTFKTIPGRVYRIKYKLSNSTMPLVNTSAFAPYALKELYTSANLSTFGIDREMIFTASESTTRFYITKGWSPTSTTANQDVYLDYLYITEVADQVNRISCASINENLTMLSASGVSLTDTTSVKNALNAYYNRTYYYAEYAAIISKCSTDVTLYVLGQPGAESKLVPDEYVYGFNGKEDDEETQTQDYGMRIYDSRLGRFLSIDPLSKEYPWYTPYQFSGNKPIAFIDRDGEEEARPEEIAYAILNPIDAVQVKANSKKAFQAAQNSGLPNPRDGQQDAFRHAYWNALNARDIGASNAAPFATIHETGMTNPANDPKSSEYDPVAIQMDLYNNDIGRRIGESNPKATDEELASLVMQALANGELKVIANIGADNMNKLIEKSTHPTRPAGDAVAGDYKPSESYEEYNAKPVEKEKKLESLPKSGTGASNKDSYGKEVNRKATNKPSASY